ncbi:hypothetical protein [Methanofollis ethanolicus]|uniref:hypothetical protein n=1 Tax=Methanofollis ethanolicus TaxID=488124 RepID=UPI00082EF271|nr:hypothetical protein [Methanofollis ethanolicus]
MYPEAIGLLDVIRDSRCDLLLFPGDEKEVLNMKTEHGLGFALATLLLASLVFVPASANDGILSSDPVLSIGIDRSGDDFLNCYAYLSGEPNWIRYGGWGRASGTAYHMEVVVKLIDKRTGQKVQQTAYSLYNTNYVEPQENLASHPPSGTYYAFATAETINPNHYATYRSNDLIY